MSSPRPLHQHASDIFSATYSRSRGRSSRSLGRSGAGTSCRRRGSSRSRSHSCRTGTAASFGCRGLSGRSHVARAVGSLRPDISRVFNGQWRCSLVRGILQEAVDVGTGALVGSLIGTLQPELQVSARSRRERSCPHEVLLVGRAELEYVSAACGVLAVSLDWALRPDSLGTPPRTWLHQGR